MLQIFSMCNAFAEAGFEVVLGLEGDENTFEKDLNIFLNSSFHTKPGFKICHWKRRSSNILVNRFLVRSSIRKLMREIEPDFMFTREPVFLKTILKKSIPVIYESHNALQHNRFRIVHQFLLKEIVKRSKAKHFLCLFSISKSLNSFWKRMGVEDDKLFSWHDGFDNKLFTEEYKQKEARNKLNLSFDKKIITYTGGLYKDREIENIIRLACNHPEHQFLIIGGPESNKVFYENFAKDLKTDNVHFTGLINHKDIPLYLYASDVLLALWSESVSTINYCSPLKLFEYMAAGRVILAHDFPTIREVLEEKDAVVFCKPGDQNALEQGIEIAIQICEKQDSADILRMEAFEKYTWTNRVVQLLGHLNISPE